MPEAWRKDLSGCSGSCPLVDWDYWSKVGEAVGGMSTAVGVLFGATAFLSWRQQKRADKMHDAAVRALSVTTRATAALRSLTNPRLGAHFDEDQDIERIRVEFSSRNAELEPLWRELSEAAETVGLYLDKEGVFLSLVKRQRVVVGFAFADYCYFRAQGNTPMARAKWNEVFGDEVQRTLEQVDKWANDGLRPIIRFESRVKWWRVALAPILLPYYAGRDLMRRAKGRGRGGS